jgi:hypothetical protein
MREHMFCEYTFCEYTLREYMLREYTLREYMLREYTLREYMFCKCTSLCAAVLPGAEVEPKITLSVENILLIQVN